MKLVLALVLCFAALCLGEKIEGKTSSFTGSPRDITVALGDNSLDVFAKTVAAPWTAYTLSVLTGDDGLSIRYSYYTDDVEYRSPQNISYEGDNTDTFKPRYTFRVRINELVEYTEANNVPGYQFSILKQGVDKAQGIDTEVRTTLLSDFQWEKFSELIPSPTADGALHFGVNARDIRDNHIINFRIHFSGGSYAIGSETLDPDSVKLDMDLTYKYQADGSNLAFIPDVDYKLSAKVDDHKTLDVVGNTALNQIPIQEGYFAWSNVATDGSGASFTVNGSNPFSDPTEPFPVPSNDGDYVPGERSANIIFSFQSNYRNSQNQLVMSWDPEFGNWLVGASSIMMVSYTVAAFAGLVHLLRLF